MLVIRFKNVNSFFKNLRVKKPILYLKRKAFLSHWHVDNIKFPQHFGELKIYVMYLTKWHCQAGIETSVYVKTVLAESSASERNRKKTEEFHCHLYCKNVATLKYLFLFIIEEFREFFRTLTTSCS